MTNWADELIKRRIDERKRIALERATNVLHLLELKNVEARIIGSLANGKFKIHSDVDFLVTKCPRNLKYSIESDVEDIMLDIPFDVVYEDELINRL